MFQRNVSMVITADEAGTVFAYAPNYAQARFLVCAAKTSQVFDWAHQCRNIVDVMDRDERDAVAVMLKMLGEHLEDGGSAR